MKDRIRKIIESQHMTQQEFAECIKVAPATLSSIFTGRTAPSLKIVEAIKGRFPDISTDWLMFGRGAMTDYKSAEAGPSFGDVSAPTGGTGPDFGPDTPSGHAASAAQDNAGNGVAAPVSTFGTDGPTPRGVMVSGASADIQNMVKRCDKHERRIAEIRIFYDDQTWETFVPKK